MKGCWICLKEGNQSQYEPDSHDDQSESPYYPTPITYIPIIPVFHL